VDRLDSLRQLPSYSLIIQNYDYASFFFVLIFLITFNNFLITTILTALRTSVNALQNPTLTLTLHR